MFKAPFSFDGRIRRIEYFLSGIIGSIVCSVAFALGVGTMFLGAASDSGAGFGIGVLIGLIALVADIWFCIAQGVKRLHDLDKSGWLYLLVLVPVVNFVFALYLLFADGTVGPNQYGDDPKNRMPYQANQNINVTVNLNHDAVQAQKTNEQKEQV